MDPILPNNEHIRQPLRLVVYAFAAAFIVYLYFDFKYADGMSFISPSGEGFPCTVVTLVMLISHILEDYFYKLTKYDNSLNHTKLEFSRFLLFVSMAAAIPLFFDGSNVINRARFVVLGESMLADEYLLNFDESLVGWLWIKGQVSLSLDQSDWFGPSSYIGIFYCEILQIFYTSYYLWGNGLGIALGFAYFKGTLIRGGMKRFDQQTIQWRKIQMFLTAWCGAFLLNFMLNVAFPAVSPRIYLENEYTQELHGIYFADKFRAALKNAAANSFSAFPSGHCGLSWLAYKISETMKFTLYSKITFVAAILITTATLVLRYHYLADAMSAVVLVLAGLRMGGFYNNDVYERLISGFGRKE